MTRNLAAARETRARLADREVAPRAWSDEQLIAVLRRVSSAQDGVLTTGTYNLHRAASDPSSDLLILRFGTWRAALAAAELDATPVRRGYSRQWTYADIAAWLRRYVAATGYVTVVGYTAWADGQPEFSGPSVSTVRKYLEEQGSSWSQAIEMTLRELESHGTADVRRTEFSG